MMFAKVFRRVFGSRNERILKRLGKAVTQINNFEEQLSKLTVEELKAKTVQFKQQLATGVSLDDILPEAFATVREAAKRSLGMRHFDVQMIGGMVLHQGKISEMSTGEGKTLSATLPAYLNALSGDGVHIITVNDYLATRDANWMAPVYHALGLTVGSIISGMSREAKQVAYACDIVYGTNNEFGFDYLRDNMAFAANERMQGKLNFAVVDEVDSILIDEARTPLIISGGDEDSSELYLQINSLAKHLELQQEKDGPGDFSLDEKNKQLYLTEDGHQKIEQLLTEKGLLEQGSSLYDAGNINLVHHVYAALRAHQLFKRDVDYIVKNNEVVIVDEHTGRTMPGRRWSDGLHQAVEAKEGVKIQSESQTLASITFQNYFRLYTKLAGMTGTADTEAYEFQQIYGLEVVVIPTNKPNIRKDHADMIYLTQEEKFVEIIRDIEDCVERKQPALVGTISIETSEYLAGLLNQKGIKHRVLNAKFHEQEAQIVAEAGRPGTVTIATNMAGRGTDIVLGGSLDAELTQIREAGKEQGKSEAELEAELNNQQVQWQERHQAVLAAGGLHILGTERHESRRIDNQLRGRASRQGDPGSTRFYLSVKDNLMRIFISDKISGFLNKLGMEKGEVITHPWISRAIENAQRKVEGHNFDIRKQLLEFDDVANDQRRVIYQQRNELMESDDISEQIKEICSDVVSEVFFQFVPQQSLEEQWDIQGLSKALEHEFEQKLDVQDWLDKDHSLHEETLLARLQEHFSELLQFKEAKIGAPNMRHLEKSIMLNILDNHWKEHLALMDYLRQSIHLRGYAQKDPKQEYKREAFEMFKEMLDSVRREVVATLARVQVEVDTDVDAVDAKLRVQREAQHLEYKHDNIATLDEIKKAELAKQQAAGGDMQAAMEQQEQQVTFVREEPKVGRNQPCPCGSGKKYKHCHGKLG